MAKKKQNIKQAMAELRAGLMKESAETLLQSANSGYQLGLPADTPKDSIADKIIIEMLCQQVNYLLGKIQKKT